MSARETDEPNGHANRFIGRDKEQRSALAGGESIGALRREIAALRKELQSARQQ